MRILVVEDDPSAAKLLMRYLDSFGECELAPDGREAIRAFRKSFRENYPYDLVCLDIIIPNGDGHETLTEIRNIEREEGLEIGEGAKVLMVSVLNDGDTILNSFMKLCDGYLPKPVTKQQLMAKLHDIGIPDPNRGKPVADV